MPGVGGWLIDCAGGRRVTRPRQRAAGSVLAPACAFPFVAFACSTARMQICSGAGERTPGRESAPWICALFCCSRALDLRPLSLCPPCSGLLALTVRVVINRTGNMCPLFVVSGRKFSRRSRTRLRAQLIPSNTREPPFWSNLQLPARIYSYNRRPE